MVEDMFSGSDFISICMCKVRTEPSGHLITSCNKELIDPLTKLITYHA